jgi:CRP/FNR family transcriptional regulator
MQVIQFSQAKAYMEKQRLDIHNSEVPVLCQSCEARHGGICGALTPDQLIELSKHSKRRKIANGSEVIGQGEMLTSYSNILSGVVKLSKMMADGRQQIVGLQFAPDFMGRPFVPESQVSAESVVDIEICALPKNIIDRMIAESPDLEHKMHQQTLKELDEARDWMLTLGRKTAQEKVASFLYLIAMNINPNDPDKTNFELPLTRADIADFLTIETVSRQMTKLRRDGVIQVENNRHVTCPDLKRLRRAAGID